MDRRSFIRQAGLAGVGAASLATVAALSLQHDLGFSRRVNH
tara:strand:- start:559 stop:681 length:123 start_codon:yes stop_codon:yes gene_type:complete